MGADGVIRFELAHQLEPLAASVAARVAALDRWRARLWEEGLIGQDGVRYGGVGWGNVSARLEGARFLITGTQTGGLAHTDERHYAVVESCEASGPRGLVRSRGPVPPSSEAMSHAALYAASSDIRFVFHVHAPALFHAAVALGLTRTPAAAEYGTVAMATAVAEVGRRGGGRGVLVMAGHLDGVLAWGASADEAGEVLLAAHRASLLTGGQAT